MNFTIVVPFFNEKKHLQTVISDIAKSQLQIVAVDDGSSDGGLQKRSFKNVTVLRHKINLGKGAAMKTGAEYAFTHGADAVIFMDADGQHDSKDLEKFISALKKGNADVVFGSRNLSMGVPFVRFVGNKIASALVSVLFGIYVSDSICGYRALTRKAYKKVKWQSLGYGVEIEMVIRTGKSGLKHVEVPVETRYLSSVKGVTILDAFGILLEVVKWRLTL